MTGRVEIDPAKPQAFLSYARDDDKFLGGAISRLRTDIEEAVGFVSARPFKIFQDTDGIGFGQDWLDRLEDALRQARFLIPVLTPRYFASEPCRAEAFRFLEYEAAAGRNDLILPIYLQDTSLIDNVDQVASHDLASRFAERQYRDWRHLAFEPAGSPRLKVEATKLAREISDAAARAVARPVEALPKPPEDHVSQLSVLEEEIRERDQTVEAERRRADQLAAELADSNNRVGKLREEFSLFEERAEKEARRSLKKVKSLEDELATVHRQKRTETDKTSQDAASGEKVLQDEIEHWEDERADVIALQQEILERDEREHALRKELAAFQQRLDDTTHSAESRSSGPASNLSTDEGEVVNAPKANALGLGLSGSWDRWLLLIPLLLMLLWSVFKFLGGSNVEEATTTAASDAAWAAAEATTEATKSAAGGALTAMVGDVDVGGELTSMFSGMTDTLSGITDVASAEAAIPSLEEMSTNLDSLTGLVDQLPEDALDGISEMVSSGLTGLDGIMDTLESIPGVGDTIRPIIDQIKEKLAAFTRA